MTSWSSDAWAIRERGLSSSVRSDEVMAIDHRQEVVPLLRGNGRQPDEVVFASLDVGQHEDTSPSGELPPGNEAATDG